MALKTLIFEKVVEFIKQTSKLSVILVASNKHLKLFNLCQTLNNLRLT